ncbi:MAG: alpha/beta fold hydrolase [Cumulibacter sp.]
MKPDLYVHANGLEFACLERGTGPLALVLHGFPDTPVSFIPLLEALADAGYRAVAPWMRGYAPTAIPDDGDFSVAALVADASALHEVLNGDEHAVIIGHDWGASVSYAAAAANPTRWSKTVVMSVPPPPYTMQVLQEYDQLKRSFYMWLFQLGIAEKMVTTRDGVFIERLWRDWSPGFDPTEALTHVRRSLAAPENLTAAIGYYRASFGAFRLGAPRPAIAPVPPPTCRQPGLYLHGANDGCMVATPELLGKIVTNFGEGSAAEFVSDAGHFLVNEQPAAVSERIVRFLHS